MDALQGIGMGSPLVDLVVQAVVHGELRRDLSALGDVLSVVVDGTNY